MANRNAMYVLRVHTHSTYNEWNELHNTLSNMEGVTIISRTWGHNKVHATSTYVIGVTEPDVANKVDRVVGPYVQEAKWF